MSEKLKNKTMVFVRMLLWLLHVCCNKNKSIDLSCSCGRVQLQGWQSKKTKRRPSGDHGSDYQETTEKIKYLQDQLRQEMEAHTRGARRHEGCDESGAAG